MLLENLTDFRDELAVLDLEGEELKLVDKIHEFTRPKTPPPSYADVVSLTTESANQQASRFIKKLFKQRQDRIIGTQECYTATDSPVNKAWIRFSKAIAPSLKISYIRLLFPDAINLLDPNSFAPLDKCSDLTSLYYDRPHKTLYTIEGLTHRAQTTRQLSTYRVNKDRQIYPLTIGELAQIKSKAGGAFAFNYSGRSYEGLWDYIRINHLPSWHFQGQLQRPLLYDLHQIIQCHFDVEKTHADTQQLLTMFNACLNSYPPSDVYALYGLRFTTGKGSSIKRVYLVDLLIQLENQSFDGLDKWLPLVAQWLNNYDASWIIDRPLPFSAKTLRNHLLALKDKSTPDLNRKINKVVKTLNGSRAITGEVIRLVEVLFKHRWLSIVGKSTDYTSLGKHVNKDPWYILVKKLKGSGLIYQSCYAFLMPTLTTTLDLITGDPIDRFSLDDFIVSSDKKSLIHLPSCEQHLISRGTFYVPGSPSKPLTPQEQEQIRRYHPAYAKHLSGYYERVTPLRFSTVLGLYKLVNHILKPKGLLFLHDYSDAEITEAEKGYQSFFKETYTKLSKKERQELDNHPIILLGEKKTFSEIVDEINQGACIAVKSLWFVQLVVDYMPWVQFNQDIEKASYAHLDDIRTASQHRLLKNEQAVIRKLQLVYTSLLTYDFRDQSIEVEAFGFRNAIPKDIGHTLFKLLHPMFSNNRYRFAAKNFQKMMTIVSDALSDTSYVSKLVLHRDTAYWLQEVLTQASTSEPGFWVDPRYMTRAISRVLPSDKAAHRYHLQTLTQTEGTVADQVRYNIFIQAIYRRLPSSDRERLVHIYHDDLKRLKICQTHVLLGKFLVVGLVNKGCLVKGRSFLFFGESFSESSTLKEKFKKVFDQWPQEFGSVGSMLTHLQSTLLESELPLNQQLLEYWQSATGHVLPVETLQDEQDLISVSEQLITSP